MRVLIVTGSFPPDRCGVGDYTANLYRRLMVDPRLKVAVLTSHTPQGDAASDDQVFRLMQGWRICQVWRFVRVVRAWSPDIVHIQYPTQGYSSTLLPSLIPRIARVLGKHVVQTWHDVYGRSSILKLLIQATVPGGLVVVRPDYKTLLHWTLHWTFWRKRMRYIKSASTVPLCTLDQNDRNRLRTRFLQGQERLIVFFGFLYPHKRAELLFDIADPETDQIVIAGEIIPDDSYSDRIRQLMRMPAWRGKASLAGYLPANDVSALLAVADAVILPFQRGGGDWNTSIHAATQEGAFVITTSLTASGYDASQNVYFARPDDTQAMRSALAKYGGHLGEGSVGVDRGGWGRIADEHIALYREVRAKR